MAIAFGVRLLGMLLANSIFAHTTFFDQTGKCGKGKYTDLLRLLFSFPAFSCLIERGFHNPAIGVCQRYRLEPQSKDSAVLCAALI
jgi:hypothetical protein